MRDGEGVGGGGEGGKVAEISGLQYTYMCTCKRPTGVCSIVSISLSRVAHSSESKEISATENTY